ncbi:hypothetical protein HK102_003472 [Quaeritorhiza haematococci]|nr:hypothetical protein HK102_003472 [Quaeritorhiza haematococci]
MDISADLTELGRTPVAVVCAGAKSILDIERTLEYLETQGVPVVTVGPKDDFPAFYIPKSGFKSPMSLRSAAECAQMIYANQALGLQNGIVFAVPIPEADAADADRIDGAIRTALKEADKKKIRGKEITPFLLARVKALTKGASLKANIALVKNNAKVGSQIAMEYAKYQARTTPDSTFFSTPAATTTTTPTSIPPSTTMSKKPKPADVPRRSPAGRPLIVGGTVLDITAKMDGEEVQIIDARATFFRVCYDNAGEHLQAGKETILGTSIPGRVHRSLGGVGRNVAEACFRTGGDPHFVSVVGGGGSVDVNGDTGAGVVEEMEGWGMDCTGIVRSKTHSTAIYNAILQSDGDLIAAVADMDVHKEIDGDLVAQNIKTDPIGPPSVVCLDGNVQPGSVGKIVAACAEVQVPVIFEPTSVPKCANIFHASPQDLHALPRLVVTPNAQEAVEMAKAVEAEGKLWDIEPLNLSLANTTQILHRSIPLFEEPEYQDLLWAVATLLRVVDTAIVKLGPRGVLIADRTHVGDSEMLHRSFGKGRVEIGRSSDMSMWTWVHLSPPGGVVEKCVSVTGAGDSLVGTLVTGFHKYRQQLGITDGKRVAATDFERDEQRRFLESIVQAGMKGAEYSLGSLHAVSRDLGPDVLEFSE